MKTPKIGIQQILLFWLTILDHKEDEWYDNIYVVLII